MEDDEMVSRSEHERQLELARQEKEAAVKNAVDAVTKKVRLQLNMRDIAMAKNAVVKNAAKETPDRPVKAVWDVADKARPPIALLAQPDGQNGELEELKAENEHLKASQMEMKEQIDGFEARLEEEKSNVHAAQQARIDTIKKQAKDHDTKRRDAITRLTQNLETANDYSMQVDQMSETSPTPMTTEPMDFAMTATSLHEEPSKDQVSTADKPKARNERTRTNPISTTNMANWTLSIDQARVLLKNKTIDSLIKSNTAIKVNQQTSDLRAVISQKEEEITNLKVEQGGSAARFKDAILADLQADLVSLGVLRDTAESKISSIHKAVLETPTRSVKQAWDSVSGIDPLQLLHRTKPRSERIPFATKLVTVNVGNPASVFNISQKLLCDASEFFRMALKEDWSEGQTKTVNLPEDDGMNFSIWLNWVYRQHLALGLNAGETRADASANKMWYTLTAAYALGDKLLDGDYKDAVIDAMLAWTFRKEGAHWYLPGIDARINLYETTTSGSTARKLLAHLMASTKNHLKEGDDHSLLFDVLQLKFNSGLSSAEDTMQAGVRCAFHEHKEGEENCYRKKNVVETFFSWW